MSCCIARRQYDQLGIRLVFDPTGRDIIVGTPMFDHLGREFTVVEYTRGFFSDSVKYRMGLGLTRVQKLTIRQVNGQKVGFLGPLE